MGVATFVQPNNTTQDATTYKGSIDAGFAVAARIIDWFAPHAQTTPNMTVALDAGNIWNGSTLTEVAAQSTGTIVKPTTNPRIDRVVIDAVTGVVAVITGTEAISPVAPAITAGKLPVARIALTTSTTSITNGIISDERVAPSGGVTGQSASVDGEIALFSGTTGKALKRMAGTGYVKATSGVASVQSTPLPSADLPDASTSAKGAVILATGAEAVAGTNALKALTAAALASFPATLAFPGQATLPGAGANPIIVKWGTFTFTSSTNGTTNAVTFGTAFPNNCFIVIPIAGEHGNGSPVTASAYSLATTGFTSDIGNTANNSNIKVFNYIAIGN